MATVRDLVNVGFDEGLIKQAVDSAGFERKRGRGGLNLDAKGVAKVVKAYSTLLTKLQGKAEKANLEKLPYGDVPVPTKPPVKKAAKKVAEPVEEDEEEDEFEDEEAEEVEDEDDEE